MFEIEEYEKIVSEIMGCCQCDVSTFMFTEQGALLKMKFGECDPEYFFEDFEILDNLETREYIINLDNLLLKRQSLTKSCQH